MEYRKLPHGEAKLSTIGIGLANLQTQGADDKNSLEVFETAFEGGINFFDLCCTKEDTFKVFGKVDKGERSKFHTQMHLGQIYIDGEYGRDRDLEKTKRAFETTLEYTGMDYTDFGFIHCVDEDEEFNQIMENGTWDYLVNLKKQGVVKHIGFSSHTPEIAKKYIDTGLVDLFMFSVNPVFDYGKGEYGIGAIQERSDFYKYCESLGIGITVMKPFAGGQLLDEKASPLGIALTHNQCIKYVLDRPAVLSALPGVTSAEEVKKVLEYYKASDEDKDYSIIGTATPSEAVGRCVYCNHCAPCPVGINVSLVNKYYDLAKLGDALAADHYKKLSLHAGDCVQCGSCNSRCPFKVNQTDRMLEIKDYFGF
ncbi:MAG: (4Fe-4S)-binding protein [Clostridiales bacterium]|nr:(4Fe-4S)-binding protein [Clostridiales bacterium]